MLVRLTSVAFNIWCWNHSSCYTMILSVSILLLALPLTFAYDRRAHFRTRRMMMMQPLQRAPFVIRVPHNPVVPTNSLFAHSVAWRTKLPQVKSSVDETQLQQEEQPQQQDQPSLSDPEIQQFQSQDTNGQVVFGFNSPDQMRIETRNPDGTVHGSYSYLDPYGQVIKRQYWDTGSGFHVTSNTYPLNGPIPGNQGGQQAVPYTPEVQAARDLHFQLYQQALSSQLPAHGPQNMNEESRENNTTLDAIISNHTSPDEELTQHSIDLKKSNDSTSSQPSPSTARASSPPTYPTSRLTTTPARFSDRIKEPVKETIKEQRPVFTAQDRVQEVNEKSSNKNEADSEVASDPETQNGSIVIENPEYLRISWTTDSKKYRLNLYNGTENSPNSTSKIQIRHDSPNMYNITKFTVRGRPK